MIAVNKYRQDSSGRVISPSALWFRKSCQAQLVEINRKASSQRQFDRSIYGDPEVRRALSKLFYDKCAYCECKLERQDMNIEHYRPKGRVAEAPCHPGYYWLAYDWENLLPSCTLCNQKRREFESLDSDQGFSTGGKGDSFPIAKKSIRANSPFDDLGLEEPMLVNPTIDEPLHHITFDPSGEAIHITDRGEVSISTYHLNARRIRSSRKNLIKELSCLLKMRSQAELMIAVAGSKAAELVEGFDALIQSKSSDASPYAGLARAVMDRPDLFDC